MREDASENHPIWHLRFTISQWLPLLREELSKGSFTLSPVKLVKTTDGSLLECWEPQDSLVLKYTALLLEPRLREHIPTLSKDCYHLSGSGGVKAAVAKVKNLTRGGHYPYIARSDAKGYYANIRHTPLLGLLRSCNVDPNLIDIVSQYCQRLRVRDGYYAETSKGISLGCSLSPLMGALYLSPLDLAMRKISGIRYVRYMDDWVILATSRWKLRHAVRVMNQVLQSLGLEQHPDKTFIGRVQRGFDFLGVQFTAQGETSPSAVAMARHTEKTARLYEQGASPERIGQYRQNWLRYLRGILGRDHPATSTQAGNLPHPTTMQATVLSSPNHSHFHRCPLEGVPTKIRNKKNEKDNTEQTRNLPRRDRWDRMRCFRG
ncbi:MAG: reverse transcriptase/maturase family protein [Verrucomicrobia bacterium]|nr:reverse transcriptase/maturase family protein [Verrucomicrobiota bacterium]